MTNILTHRVSLVVILNVVKDLISKRKIPHYVRNDRPQLLMTHKPAFHSNYITNP